MKTKEQQKFLRHIFVDALCAEFNCLCVRASRTPDEHTYKYLSLEEHNHILEHREAQIKAEHASFMDKLRAELSKHDTYLEKENTELQSKIERLTKALERIESETHSWVIRQETAALLRPIYDKFRAIAREALKAVK